MPSSHNNRESDSNIADASEGYPEKHHSSRNSTETGKWSGVRQFLRNSFDSSHNNRGPGSKVIDASDLHSKKHHSPRCSTKRESEVRSSTSHKMHGIQVAITANRVQMQYRQGIYIAENNRHRLVWSATPWKQRKNPAGIVFVVSVWSGLWLWNIAMSEGRTVDYPGADMQCLQMTKESPVFNFSFIVIS
jgi:hypothetical protein